MHRIATHWDPCIRMLAQMLSLANCAACSAANTVIVRRSACIVFGAVGNNHRAVFVDSNSHCAPALSIIYNIPVVVVLVSIHLAVVAPIRFV